MVNRYLFVKQNRGILYGFGIISTLLLIAGNIFFVSQNTYFLFYGAYVLFTAIYLWFSYFVGVTSREFDLVSHKLYKSYVDTEVDIFLPVCGEPISVLANTWTGVAEVRGFKKVFVLDDGKSSEVEKLAKEFGFVYITRPTKE